MKKLLAVCSLALGILSVCAAEYRLLPQLDFIERPDLAGGRLPKPIKEPTTGVIINAPTGSTGTAYSMQTGKDGSLQWRMAGDVSTLFKMYYTATMPAADYKATPYYRVKVRAKGLLRSIGKYNVLTLNGKPLFEAGDFYNDGRVHTISGRFAQLPKAGEELKLELATDNSSVELSILEFNLYDKLTGDEQAFIPAKDLKGYTFIDISSQFNAITSEVVEQTVKQFNRVHDYPALETYSDGKNAKLSVKGVPFAVTTVGKNIVMPPDSTAKLRKQGTFFDTPIGNNYFRPTRLDEVVVPLTGKTSELYAILGGKLFPVHGEYVAPAIPMRVADVDCFGIQIDYADGTHDRCVPRHIAADGFGIQGVLSAYAIPVDETKELQAVRFQNRFSNIHIGLMALTMNQGAPTVISNALREPAAMHVNPGKAVTEKALQVTQDGTRIILANSHYQVVFNGGESFAIESIKNLHAPELPMALKEGGFEIRLERQPYSSKCFRTEKATVLPDGVEFVLKSNIKELPLQVVLKVTGGKGDELLFQSKLVNLSAAPLRPIATIPMLDGMTLGEPADTWVYYPKHRVVNRNTAGSWFSPIHERAIHVQFMDFYNPKAGAGLAVHTRDRDAELFDYVAIRNDEGIRTGIHYPRDWSMLPPNGQRKMVDVALQFHGGDWHQALKGYQNWLATWFKPYPTELPDAWRNLFYLRGENMFKRYNWQIALIDPQTQEFRMDGFREKAKDYMDGGVDMWHLSFWNMPPNSKTDNSGNYDDGCYDPKNYYPSETRLKQLIDDCHKRGELVSVYTIATYLPKDSAIGKKDGDRLAQINGIGGKVAGANVIFPCFDLWADTYAKALKRAQAELKLDAVYLDCYPFGRYSNTCYANNHGHPYPMQLNKSQRNMLIKIREALPKNVAIWTEDPSIDYDAALLSGNITYYCTTIHEHRAKSYDVDDAANRDFYEPLQNIQRFTMPHLKQVCFVCGWIPSGPRMNEINGIFFNGEGINDAAFCLYDDHSRAKVQHWLKIQRALVDCFNSLNIFPMVSTAAGEIYANCFQGNDRTAWTLWNGRYQTYRGNVLRVPYKEGAAYYDAWNARPVKALRQGDEVILSVEEMEPQGLGCIIEYFGELPKGLPETTIDEREKHLVTYP